MSEIDANFPRYKLEPTTFDGPLVDEGAEATVKLIVHVVEVPPVAARERGRPVLLRVIDFAGPTVARTAATGRNVWNIGFPGSAADARMFQLALLRLMERRDGHDANMGMDRILMRDLRISAKKAEEILAHLKYVGWMAPGPSGLSVIPGIQRPDLG